MSSTKQVTLPAPVEGYSSTIRALHWVGALLVFVTWWLGISLPEGPARGPAMALHSSFGVLVLSLAVLRILWRSVTPQPVPEGPALLVTLAKIGHVTLYALTLALPVTGLLARWTRSGHATLIGGFDLPAPFPLPATKLWAWTHTTIAYALAALVAAHVGAVLFHHLVLRDGVLRRMVPALPR